MYALRCRLVGLLGAYDARNPWHQWMGPELGYLLAGFVVGCLVTMWFHGKK